MRERVSTVLLGVAVASLVFALGAYGGSVAGGERGGFVMNFPATGEKVGGPSPRALTGRIGVSLDDAGVFKRLAQPNVIEISSHVVSGGRGAGRLSRGCSTWLEDGAQACGCPQERKL